MQRFDHINRRKSLPTTSHLKGKCSSGKLRYKDHEMAIEALHKALNAGSRAMRDTGFTRRNEKRAYACAQCKGWHLTHLEAWADSLQMSSR